MALSTCIVYNGLACLRFGLITLGVLGLDLASKTWVQGQLTLGQSLPVLPGCLAWTWVENSGMAFSLLANVPGVLPVLSAVLLLGVLGLLYRPPAVLSGGWVQLGLCWVFAGGLANCFDRLADGRVTDFIQLQFISFPIFNVADIAVSLGCACMLLGLLRSGGLYRAAPAQTGCACPTEPAAPAQVEQSP